jgi:hypothetical protein
LETLGSLLASLLRGLIEIDSAASLVGSAPSTRSPLRASRLRANGFGVWLSLPLSNGNRSL